MIFRRKAPNPDLGEVVAGSQPAQQKKAPDPVPEVHAGAEPAQEKMPSWATLAPALACGAGMFSDGYINNVIGSVVTLLAMQYGDVWQTSTARHYLGDIAFAGTVVGQLVFGYLSDKWSRQNSLLLSTALLFAFVPLTAGFYFPHSAAGVFRSFAAWRFFIGLSSGGEYPAGSVGCAESTNDLKSGTRNMWFILFTNTMVNCGLAFGAFLPWLVAKAFHNQNLQAIWRVSLGIGAIFPGVLLVVRVCNSQKEPKGFQEHSLRRARTPYRLVLRFYGPRLFAVSLLWFIYDFTTSSFTTFPPSLLTSLSSAPALPSTIFASNTLLTLLLLPGTLLGIPLTSHLGPRKTLALGAALQASVALSFAACHSYLAQPANIATFTAVYGVFLSLGELGPGNNIGVLAAKTCATGVRGQYYGVAAAVGRVGGFVGSWVFRDVGAVAGGGEGVFWVAGGLAVVAVVVVMVGLPEVGQDGIGVEDERFRVFLEGEGWDVRQMGARTWDEEMGGQAVVVEKVLGAPKKAVVTTEAGEETLRRRERRRRLGLPRRSRASAC